MLYYNLLLLSAENIYLNNSVKVCNMHSLYWALNVINKLHFRYINFTHIYNTDKGLLYYPFAYIECIIIVGTNQLN